MFRHLHHLLSRRHIGTLGTPCQFSLEFVKIRCSLASDGEFARNVGKRHNVYDLLVVKYINNFLYISILNQCIHEFIHMTTEIFIHVIYKK